MGSELTIILRALDKASKPVKNVSEAVDDLGSKSSSTLSKGLMPLQNALGMGLKFAAGAGIAAVGAFAGIVTKATGAAMSMEQQVADIASIMNLTKEEVEPLKKLIKDLGLDPKLKVDATEAADAIQMLARNGLTMEQILGGAARSTVLLSNATGADFGTSADIATDAMKLFNISAENMDQAVNGISSVLTSSKFGINDYRLALANAGGMAKTVGLGFSDFNTTISGISSYFASGSEAGTGFKTFLQRLIPTTKPAKDAMTALGLYTEETGSVFFDSTGKLKSMAEIVEILNSAVGGLSAEQKELALTTIFGSDALGAAAGIAGMTRAQFEQLNKTMNETDAAKMAATRVDTLTGALEILQGVIDGIVLEIGDAFLPIVRDLAGVFIDFVSKHQDKIIGFFKSLATNINAVYQWAKVLVVEGDAMNDWLTHMHPTLAKVIEKTVEFFNAGKKVLDFVRDMFKPVTDIIAKYVSWKDVLVSLGIVLGVTILPFIGSLLSLLWSIAAPLGVLIAGVAALRNAWESDFLGIKTTATGAFNAVLQGIKDVTNGVKTWKQVIGEWALAAWVWLRDTVIPNVTREIGRWGGILNGWLSDNLPTWKTKIGEWASVAWVWLRDIAIPATVTQITSWANSIFNTLSQHYPTWRAKLGDWAREAWVWITETAIPKAVSKLSDWGSALWDWLSIKLPIWVTELGTWAAAAWEWLTKIAIPLVAQKIGVWGSSLWTWLTNNLPTWKSRLSEWATAAWEWLVGAATNVGKKISSWGSTLYNYLKDNLPSWKERLQIWGNAAADWISNTITLQRLRENLAKWRSTVFTWYNTNVPKASEFLPWITGIVEWIGDSIPVAIENMTDVIVNLIDWMLGPGLDKFIEGLADMFVTGMEEGTAGQALVDALFNMVIKISVALAEAGARIAWAIISGLAEAFIPGADHITEVIEKFVSRIWEAFKKYLRIDSPSRTAYEMGQDLVQGLIDGFNSLINNFLNYQVPNFLGGIVGKFRSWLSKGTFHGIGWDFVSGLIEGFNDIMDGFMNNHIPGVLRHIKSVFSSMLSKDTLKGIGSDVVWGLIDGFNSTMDNFVNKHIPSVIRDIKGKFEDLFNLGSPSKDFMEYGKFLVEGLQIGVLDSLGPFLNSLNTVTDQVASAMNTGRMINNTSTINNVRNYNIALPTRDLYGNSRDENVDTQATRLIHTLSAVTG